MKIPNAENAVVDIRKLRDYCLNPWHDEGKHKARLFSAALDMKADDAEELRSILLQAVQANEAQFGRQDAFGQRYVVDIEIQWRRKQALVRSAWIIEHHSTIPRLTSCYPL